MRQLDRDFDGSEAADTELQDASREARSADVAAQAAEIIRDAASETWTVASGEVWTAWRGSRRGTRLTAAQIDARQALRAVETQKVQAQRPNGPIVAFRGAPFADTAEDAGRIFDALNWAHREWPEMALATTGARGAEKLAIKWARQKNVVLVLARADFDRHGKAAPFRANDEMLALDPICCLSLSRSVRTNSDETARPFGPSLNLAQQAEARGIRHLAIRAR